MEIGLEDLVPWGRRLSEYTRIFQLTSEQLRQRILGCADGPSSFNAEMTRQGGNVISCDPLYAFSYGEIEARSRETNRELIEKLRCHPAGYDWNYFADSEAVSRARIEALSIFLADFEDGKAQGRYLPAALPHLPFAHGAFDLALCSFLFFLRPERHSISFHIDGLTELIRVAREVRVFPILQVDGRVPDYAEDIYDWLRAKEISVSFLSVPPTLHKGADRVLVLQR
jgi:hypothetical protein